MNIADESLQGISQMLNDSETSGSAERKTLSQLTLFAEDSPARIFPLPDQGTGLTESAAVCGGKCSESLANYDQSTSLWKTSQHSLFEELTEFSGTWPKSGMTQNGKLYELIGLDSLIPDAVYSSLPTLRASQWKNRYWCSFREDHHSNLDEFIGSVFPSLVGEMINLNWLEWHMGFPIGWTDLNL